MVRLFWQQEGETIEAIAGAAAMNLDGGASVALAHNGRTLMIMGRN